MADEGKSKSGGISLFALVALVVSSSIGGGVFNLSSDIASGSAPGPAIIAWIMVGFGILMLALSLNNLILKEPELTGIFTYAEKGWGKFAGFISGWGYWLSAWLGNIAFATLLMSALGYFFPVFKGGQNLPSILVASIISWLLTFLVNRGVESAAAMNVIITICKIIPLFVFIVVAIVLFNGQIFTHAFWNRYNSNFQLGDVAAQIKNCLMVMMWVFVGIEGASQMSSRAKKKSDAGKATIIGLVCLLFIYILSSLLPFGYMTQSQLAHMQQPSMLYIFEKMVGPWGGYFIGAGVIISLLGAWLSWTMLPAETLMLMSEDGLLPKKFGEKNKHNAPTFSLMLTAVLVQIFLFTLLFTDKAYNFAYSLCTASIIVCYIFVGAYQIKFSVEHPEQSDSKKQAVIGILAFSFEVFGLILAGWQYLMLCFIAYVLGIYLYGKARQENGRKEFLTKQEWIISAFILAGAIVAVWMVATGQFKI